MDIAVLWIQILLGTISILVVAGVSIRVQKESARTQIKFDAYKQICQAITSASNALAATCGYVLSLPKEFRNASNVRKSIPPQRVLINFDLQRLADDHSNAFDKLTTVVPLVSQYRVLLSPALLKNLDMLRSSTNQLTSTFDTLWPTMDHIVSNYFDHNAPVLAFPISDTDLESVDKQLPDYIASCDFAAKCLENLFQQARSELIADLFRPRAWWKFWR
jgi:hypothetical protein